MQVVSKCKIVITSLLILSLFQALSNSSSAADATKTVTAHYRYPLLPAIQTLPTPLRVLKFPDKLSVGGIAVLKKAYFDVDDVADDLSEKKINQKAQGTITVPANRFVVFFPNHNSFANPHILDALPANSFDHVVFRYISMDASDSKLGNPALAYLGRFTGLRCLDLLRAEINDEGLKPLKTLVNLEYLDLFSTEVDGTFLKSLTNLKKLRFIGANNIGFKKSELRYFCQLAGLTTLNLSHNRFHDRDIEVLAGCKNLVTLGLGNNPEITDGVLKTLAQMPKLRNIDLRETQISEKALASLEHRGVHLRGRVPSRPANVPPRHKGSGGIEEIFSPFSRGREL
ncbi:hypothetical protein BH11CYA1_BH11CYA1_09750 [soil metagenome]